MARGRSSRSGWGRAGRALRIAGALLGATLGASSLSGALVPCVAQAQVPGTLTVQGILRDADGVPVVGSVPFVMELRTATRSLWTESQSATLEAGLFTLTLGATTPIEPSVFAAGPVSLVLTVDGEAMAPIALTSVPYAFRAASADSADSYTGDVAWGQLTEVPAGFADGTDDGAAYAAGTGLVLTGSTFSVDASVVQSRVTGSCPAGQSIRAIGADGTVTCELDDVGATGTTYAAGTGLVLTGTTFSVDAASVQARVTSSCGAGASIRAIGSDGTVVCETDDDTTYAAGAGLVLAGTTFSVDTSAVQARVSGSCPAGESIRAISSSGTVTCEADDNTTYTAGAGVTLTGTTFSVDASAVQARVAGTCPAGQSIRAIGSDGTVTCEVDDVGSAYTAGAGLALTGTTFSVDTSVVQARVTGTCPAGQSVRTIGSDGTVTCEVDDDTTYTAGAGLALTGTTFSVNTAVVQARVTGSCPAGQSIRAIGSDGTVTCEAGAASPALGDAASNPATSCAAIRTARATAPTGVYWLRPVTAASAFQAYCDMTTDGGGWTLVWSNLRGGRAKPTTELDWQAAVNTLPRVVGTLGNDPESFLYFIGLRHWVSMSPGTQLRYSWANDYGSPIDQSYRCTYGFTLPNYNLGLISCTQLVGTTVPGLFSTHNNAPFSAYNRDLDGSGTNCAASFSNAPFWYTGCWDGSINGGGEFSQGGYYNGAYWSGSSLSWGTDAGVGAGNGWIFVR